MKSLVTALRWIARLDGLIALILGFLVWTGSGSSLKVHIWTGFVMVLVLLVMGLIGFFARIKPVMPIIAILWGLFLPYFGFAQLKMMPGAGHITIQVLHLLIGVLAIGIVEMVAAKVVRQAQV